MESYEDIINWLFRRFLNYQNIGYKAINPGLKMIKKLSNYLDNPHKNYNIIHIAGTNGKGSTANMLSSILQEANYKVGLFTSPHLLDFSERIKFNGKCIDRYFVKYFIKKYKNFLDSENFSFFEISTIMAFYFFKEKKADLAIIETGLGGRLDSTNIVNPLISIITHIGLDHMNLLGNNVEKIAYEKSGIIKYKVPVIIGPNVSKTENIFLNISRIKKSPIFFSEKIGDFLYKTPLINKVQILNQSTILKSIKVLKKLNINISNKNIENGFKNIFINTNLKGRWQCINNKPKIICDVAHNIDSIKILIEQLSFEEYDKLHLILGFIKNNNIYNILSFLPKNENYYFCEPNIPRKYPIFLLKKITNNLYKNSKYFNCAEDALLNAKNNASEKDLILITGSHFIVSDILKSIINY